MDLILLFELFSIKKHKQSNQIDIYLTSILIGQKSTNQIAQYMVERRPQGGQVSDSLYPALY